MKKTTLTIAIILGLGIGAFAQQGGLFGRGPESRNESQNNREDNGSMIHLPSTHGQTTDANADAPLGGGVLLLIGLGAAYALKKKEDK